MIHVIMTYSQVALLSVNEWNRIQDQICGVNIEKEEALRRQERKEARRHQSLATVKHWENTIEVERILLIVALL